MNYLKLVQNIAKDLRERLNDFETIKFFRKDLISHWIWIVVLEKYYNNEVNDNNIERIIQNIPSELGSRPTLFKVIDIAVSKKFLIKELNKKDKRKFDIIPSEKTIIEFEEWAKIFKDM